EGRLTGPREVTVVSAEGTRTYAGKQVVLASGSYSKSLPGLDLDGARVLTPEHALRLDRVPRSVVVLGGGVIGCEFASVWASFGSGAPIAAGFPRVLRREARDAV